MALWTDRANRVLPGGGFGNFDASIVIERGDGAYLYDTDGNKYIDYLIGSGPMLLGHANDEVNEAITEQLSRGTTFFASNPSGIELAEVICDAVPCADFIRFVSSGGEADMYALRLARAFTGRDKIIKFEGGYHGMSADAQMSLFPTGPSNFPHAAPDSAGIPDTVRREILVAPFNDAEYVASLFDEYKNEIAGIIVEPLQRIVPPAPGFLETLRKLCDVHGAILIFDEVVTGFRFSYGGAQSLYGVTPDLCTLGKLIGGGLPLAAIAGRKDIMTHFDKSQVGSNKFLVQIGTLSGNPLASVAGLKTLEIMRRSGQYERLNATGQRLMAHMTKALDHYHVPHRIVGHPTLFEAVFTENEVNNYRDVLAASKPLTTAFNTALRREGIFKSPGKMYTSLALSDDDVAATERAITLAAKATAAAM